MDTIFKKGNSQLYIKLIIKYVTEGMIVALCAYYIPPLFKNSLRKPQINEIFAIGLTASLTMFILDTFASQVGQGARLGVGFGIGNNLVSR